MACCPQKLWLRTFLFFPMRWISTPRWLLERNRRLSSQWLHRWCGFDEHLRWGVVGVNTLLWQYSGLILMDFHRYNSWFRWTSDNCSNAGEFDIFNVLWSSVWFSLLALFFNFKARIDRIGFLYPLLVE